MGFNGENRLRSTEYYDGKLWQRGPNMTRERSNFAGSILNGKIIVCGGYNEKGTCLGWTEEESMNISRSALTSIVLSDLSKDRLIGLLPKRSKKPKRIQLTFPNLRRLTERRVPPSTTDVT